LSTDHVDSYVLSESSLFVFPTKVILKTCGTTTLLNCLDKLEEISDSCSLRPRSLLYSRKNFNFPKKQLHPHTNFEVEVAILREKFPRGTGHILGPVHSASDHHFSFFWQDGTLDGQNPLFDPSLEEEEEPPPTMEVMMSRLDEEAMSHFFRDGGRFVDAKATTRQVGLASPSLLPDLLTDEHMFDPCGFSLNGISLSEPGYFTVHVTPEASCSFVSFETQRRCPTSSLLGIVSQIVAFFRPARFSLVISSQVALALLPRECVEGYTCKFSQVSDLEGFSVLMMNFWKTSVIA